MRFILCAGLALCLSACSLTPTQPVPSESYTVDQAICLPSKKDAKRLGHHFANNGYTSRVSYWVYGDSTVKISSLALLWKGFDRHNYCAPDQYPIVIRFREDQTGIATDQVYKWSKIVLENMLRERGVKI